MSLIRTAVVVGVVIYAMPTDPQKQHALIQSASDTLVWTATYCQREPETCRQAGVVLNAAVQKAKFGIALASDMAGKWSEQHQANGSQAAAGPASTLTIDDVLAASPDQPVNSGPAAQNTADPSVDG